MSPLPPSCAVSQASAHSMEGLQRSLLQKLPSRPPSRPAQSEGSLAFKRWAHGRCYRCLAHDHQVRSCKDAFRCIRCRRAGHRERHCHFRFPSPSPRVNPSLQHHHSETSQTTDAIDGSPHAVLPASQPSSTHKKDANHVCCNSCCCALHASASLDPKSTITPLLELLRSELDHLIAARMEEVVRPIREEISTIKFWLARVTNLLERAESDGAHMSASNMPELFGPCSPVKLSPAPMVFASLAEACKGVESGVCKDISDSVADEVIPKAHGDEMCEEANSCIDEMTTRSSAEILVEIPMKQTIEVTTSTCTSQTHLNPCEVQQLQQDDDQVEDVVLVENASEDEVVILDACVTHEDPIFLSTVEDGPAQPTFNLEKAQPCDDLSRDESCSAHSITTEDGSIAFPPPLTKALKHRRKSYVRSSLRRNAHVARQNKLKKLGIVGKNGQLDVGKLLEYADGLKELLPLDLRMALLSLKGRAFWDTLAALSSHLR